MAKSPEGGSLVNVKVLVSGRELSGEFQLFSVDVYKEINKISGATLKFLDGDVSTQEFEVSNKSDLNPGAELEIKAGFNTKADTIFKGIIVRHGVKADGDISYTEIECKDKAVLMTIEKRSDIYEKKTDGDIIKNLIGRYSGLKSKMDKTSFTHPQLLQYDSTDWDFLVLRAELNGLVVATVDNEIQALKPRVASPDLILTYGKDVLSFEADVNATSQFSKVTAQSWNVKNQELTKKEVTSVDFEDTGDLKSKKLADEVKKDGSFLYHPGNMDPNELKEWGSSVLLKQQMAKLSGYVKSNGYADIQPGGTLELKGVGKKFNGKLYVTKVRHEILEGKWETSSHFGVTPEIHSEKFNISQKEASGTLPAVHGLQTGVVKKIHEDPDNQHRIQVSLPVFGSKVNVWARMAFPDAGKERGMYFVPEVNDEVIVGFLNDDARFPVILGSLFSSKNAPPLKVDQKNEEKGIVTKEKVRFVLSDKDKKVELSTPGEQSIVIDDKEGSIVLKDKNGNSVTLKKNLIELKGGGDVKISASKNITIEGMKVNVKAKSDIAMDGTNIKQTAKAQFQAKGNAKAELNAGGQAVVKGGAMVQVQGALVKIN